MSKDIQELQAQLAKLSIKTDGILNVREFGAIGDNIRHPLREKFASLSQARKEYPHAQSLDDEIDWCAIQAALEAGESQGGADVHIPAGQYKINRTIYIPDRVNLEMNLGAELMVTADVNVIHLKRGGQLFGGTINVHSNLDNFSRSCIFVSGEEDFQSSSNLTRVSNIMLRNWNPGDRPSGVGIHLYAKGDEKVPNQSICWLHVNNINMSWFNKGVYLQAVKADDADTNPGKTAWINGNSFHQVHFHACGIDICLEGSDGFAANQPDYSFEVSGNHFTDVQSQPMAYTMYFSVSGRNNRIVGKFWDTNIVASDTKARFTKSSSYNKVTSNVAPYQVSDEGNFNMLLSAYRNYWTGIIPPAINTSYTFAGNQDDFLAHALARGFLFTQTAGAAPLSGQLEHVFSLGGDASVVWDGSRATADNPIVLDLIFPKQFAYFTNFGLAFSPWAESPKGIVIRRRQSGQWRTVVTHKDLGNQPFFVLNSVLAPVDALQIKLWGTNDAKNNRLRLTRIFGQSTHEFGYAFLPRSGGDMYGNLNMNQSYLTVGHIARLPTASQAHRGKIIRVLGNGTTTADTMYICLRSASGTYSWKPIVQG